MSLLILGIVIAGCAQISAATDSPSRSDVDFVRNGVLPAYTSKTVGKAFEGTFQNPKWTSFTSAKGVHIVQFNGSIPAKALAGFPNVYLTNLKGEQTDILWSDIERKCFGGVPDPCRLPVMFRFAISPDKKTPELAYIDTTVFGTTVTTVPVDLDAVVAFIYR
jgi:hypothetical protein